MEEDILDYLKKDLDLNSILGGFELYPISVEKYNKTSVVYNFSPITKGVINQTKLDLNIISKNYRKSKGVERVLLKLLGFDDDNNFVVHNTTKFNSLLSGGGMLQNPIHNVLENTLTFIISWRSTK